MPPLRKSLPKMGHCSQGSLGMAQPLCWSPKSFLESIIFFLVTYIRHQMGLQVAPAFAL